MRRSVRNADGYVEPPAVGRPLERLTSPFPGASGFGRHCPADGGCRSRQGDPRPRHHRRAGPRPTHKCNRPTARAVGRRRPAGPRKPWLSRGPVGISSPLRTTRERHTPYMRRQGEVPRSPRHSRFQSSIGGSSPQEAVPARGASALGLDSDGANGEATAALSVDL